eukprot:TRINITY_DN56869_c0_g1_i1.p1 TRINITY_DN56869_c0_g1~~TRINITY_DN56869_c0_g1_i1.p1  ORF type:complete len:690 (+),score=46.21 TRINITY_DN56869_c0_g1_i1:168-2072(+)
MHVSHLCKIGHWHGLGGNAADCPYCSEDGQCGGGMSLPYPLKADKDLRTRLLFRALFHSRLHDPFKEFDTDNVQTEDALHHHYDFETGWHIKPVQVKIESKEMGRGALRSVYRCLIRDPDSCNIMWRNATPLVAKLYIDGAHDRDDYRNDVKMQMVAKQYATWFNKEEKAPSQIDFVEASYIKLLDRNPQQRYAIESFIDGTYAKFNTNAGSLTVSTETGRVRSTPQAFSHYTFERSGKKELVVDIQGVGALYTDPQIVTESGKEYGDGNIGLAGFALFFHAHRCNHVCKAMGLTPFDTYETVVDPKAPPPKISLGDQSLLQTATKLGALDVKQNAPLVKIAEPVETPPSPSHKRPQGKRRRASQVDGGILGGAGAKRRRSVSHFLKKEDFPHFVDIDTSKIPPTPTVEALVHFKLAIMHQSGRLEESGATNHQACLYHFQRAAQLGHVTSMVALAKLHSDTAYHKDILPEVSIEDKPLALALLSAAGERGHEHATANLATSNHHGYLSEKPDWQQAAHWYQKYITLRADAASCGSPMQGKSEEEPEHVMGEHSYGWEEHGLCMADVMLALAELYSQGGNGLERDPQQAYDWYGEAAEEFMNVMKGKLANRCYEKQAELEAELPDEEEDGDVTM